jgi:cytochrome P450
LRARRGADGSAGDDITSSLLHERLADRPLSDEEITSILRNFTVGEVGTISAAVGILLHDLAQHTGLQQQLRATPALLPAAIEEILRRHGPLVTNRRVTTRAVEIGGRHLPAQAPVTINWVSANRDERTFDDPDAVRLDRDQTANLLYGAGLHVCPGAPLARLELRVVMEEVLSRTSRIELVAGKPPVPAVYPASGFDTLFLRVG